MTIHSVTAYPVCNGDTSQIVLANGRRILLDFCHRASADDPKTPEINLKAHLTKELKDAGRNSFDVVAFTHGDDDHVHGSAEFFELRHAAKYQSPDRIKIDELWMPAAMLLEVPEQGHQSDDNAILRREGQHRLLEGNGIKVFSKPLALMEWLEPRLRDRGESANARDHLFVDAGTLVPGFGLATDGVEFFVHSPFKEHCADGDIIRNIASLAFNIRFSVNGVKSDYLHFGDSEWEALEDIVRITLLHGNGDRLKWNLFNIPHHLSYKCLSDEKGEQETVPKPLVAFLLRQGQADAYIVSSSKPVADRPGSYLDVQPPHIQARKAYERYLREVGGRKLFVTMEEPHAYRPEPLVFEITSGGVGRRQAMLAGAAGVISSTPPRAGTWRS